MNPDPDIYTSWEEFAKQLFWDYQLGEVFVLATARYATGWPARFHVVPAVDGQRRDAERRAASTRSAAGTSPATCCTSATSRRVADAHGHGPLEAGRGRAHRRRRLRPLRRRSSPRPAASRRRSSSIPRSSPPSRPPLCRPSGSPARVSAIGEPAVLSGGVTFKPMQANPKDMALVDLSQLTESRIAVLLGVPPFLVGLPSGGDSMTYANVTSHLRLPLARRPAPARPRP